MIRVVHSSSRPGDGGEVNAYHGLGNVYHFLKPPWFLGIHITEPGCAKRQSALHNTPVEVQKTVGWRIPGFSTYKGIGIFPSGWYVVWRLTTRDFPLINLNLSML